jgi:hypothetical protein
MKTTLRCLFVAVLATTCGCVQFVPYSAAEGQIVEVSPANQVAVIPGVTPVLVSETRVLPLVPLPGLTWIPGFWVWHGTRAVTPLPLGDCGCCYEPYAPYMPYWYGGVEYLGLTTCNGGCWHPCGRHNRFTNRVGPGTSNSPHVFQPHRK